MIKLFKEKLERRHRNKEFIYWMEHGGWRVIDLSLSYMASHMDRYVTVDKQALHYVVHEHVLMRLRDGV